MSTSTHSTELCKLTNNVTVPTVMIEKRETVKYLISDAVAFLALKSGEAILGPT